ncbi:hypothetical protein GX408_06105 [bacterium]|nr:hypothetical protein [bacterium]
MKPINKLFLLLLISVTALFGQDVQQLYDQAREVLTSGQYDLALTLIREAKSEINKDPQVDPNQVFANRLLPQVEKNALTMGELAAALQALNQSVQNELFFQDLAPGPEAVRRYTAQAKEASLELIRRRDEIIRRYVLAPEYRSAVRGLPMYAQTEQLASVGIMDRLSEQFERMTTVLVDSLNAVDLRYRRTTERLAQLVKSNAANKAQVAQMSKEVARLSQERLNYINSIAEMLVGESSAESFNRPVTLNGNQVENAFIQAIQSEMARLRSLTSVDSAEYRDLAQNYEKIAGYNRIFAKNRIAADQSTLIAQYKAALDAVSVRTPMAPKATSRLFYFIATALLLVILVVILVAASKKRSTTAPPARFS